MRDREKSTARARSRVTMTAQSVAMIEAALQEMDATIVSLDRRAAAEEMRSRTTDKTRVTYSTVALAARARSDNLRKSVVELEAKVVAAAAEHRRALAALSALENAPEGPPLVRLPLTTNDTLRQSNGQRRLHNYQRRTVNVRGPTNDNLTTGATSTAQ